MCQVSCSCCQIAAVPAKEAEVLARSGEFGLRARLSQMLRRRPCLFLARIGRGQSLTFASQFHLLKPLRTLQSFRLRTGLDSHIFPLLISALALQVPPCGNALKKCPIVRVLENDSGRVVVRVPFSLFRLQFSKNARFDLLITELCFASVFPMPCVCFIVHCWAPDC